MENYHKNKSNKNYFYYTDNLEPCEYTEIDDNFKLTLDQ